jgi:hypothetical protein
LSSSQKQAEWKLWAAEIKYKGKGLIGGYGIRWNIAYDSRVWAYEGRRVIKSLLENEDKRLAGKSTKDHFFKSYELSSKEWEEVNNLNSILKVWLLTLISKRTHAPFILTGYRSMIGILGIDKINGGRWPQTSYGIV